MNIAAEHPAQNASARTAKLLIDGQFVESKSAEWRDIVNLATQEVVGRVPFATDGRSERRRRCGAQGVSDLAQHAARRAHAHHAQISGPGAAESEAHCADAD